MANAQKIKVKVERKFIDRHTKDVHQVGEVMSVTKRRLEEITGKDASLVSVVAE